MKKLLVLLAVAMMLSGCTKAPGTADVKEPDYSEKYMPALNRIYDEIYDDSAFNPEDSEYIGISVVGIGRTAKETLMSVGYTLKDLNGDTVPELIVGTNETYDGLSDVYLIYTLSDDVPVMVMRGWYRSTIRLLDDGKIYSSGSGGAAYYAFGTYRLDDNGLSAPIDFYFTDYKDDQMDDIGFYHNTTAVWDKNQADEYDGTSDEFYEISNDLYSSALSLEFTPLFELKEYVPLIARFPVEGEIGIFRCDEGDRWIYSCDHLEAQMTEEYFADEAVIAVGERISDVDVVMLEYTDGDPMSIDSYTKTVVYHFDEITADMPLLVKYIFPETIPNCAIIYRNSDGAVRNYALSCSWMDGSPSLFELTNG